MRTHRLKDPLHPEGGPLINVKNDHDCIFCKHLQSLFWDYTHGPYMFFCELHEDENHIDCIDFEEDEQND